MQEKPQVKAVSDPQLTELDHALDQECIHIFKMNVVDALLSYPE